ncbi:MAG: sigma-54-dependent Fis family transcriptional regulator [Planctomycetaceae bacterium]|nr:sigma-54-dependent Fis family transcriptional regulator [Planctomycetaceae bacterium]
MSLQSGPAFGSLLVVDDDAGIREAMAEYLRSLGHRVEVASDCDDGVARLKVFPFDVVVCDVCLPDRDGYHLLEWAVANRPDTSVVLLTGYGTIEGAIEAIRLGAFEYLTKPLIEEELSLSIRKALGQRQIVEENKRLRQRLDEKFGLGTAVGRDYKMQRMFDLIESVADTRTTVLILGESGTGKTMTARAIHQLSSRREKPFIEVACGALPESLLESELFGHVKGSFTGASQDKVGKFLQADGGTLFLDEIATASPGLQVKLLRAIQDREFEPVGGNRTHKVDVRLILATNADLKEQVEKGQFREDLYYRINVISLTQPPLRERIGDIPLLAEHYLGIFREQTGKRVNGFDVEAMRVMQAYRWPGNVRELVNVVERAVVLCRGSQVMVNDLPDNLREDPSIRAFDRAGGTNLKAALAMPERQMILDTLAANHWNRQDSAKMLGINRTTLYKKMKRLDIDIELEMMKARG